MEYELNIDIDWSKGQAATDQFLSQVSSKIAALQSRMALPANDPQHLSSTQFGQQARVQVEVAKQVAKELHNLGRISEQTFVGMVRDINKAGLALAAGAGKTAENAYVQHGAGGQKSKAYKEAAPIASSIIGGYQEQDSEARQAAEDFVNALRQRVREIRALAALDAEQRDEAQKSIALQAEINAADRVRAAAIKARTAALLRGNINELAANEATARVFDQQLRSRVDLRTSGELAQDPQYAERLGRTAANERAIELRKQLELERQISRNMAENVRLVAEEAQLRRLRLAAEKAASTDFSADPARARAIADLEARSAINERINASRVKERTSGFYAGDSAEAIALREREAVAAVDDKIATIRRSIEYERLYSTYLQQNAQEVAEEFALRQGNNALLKRQQQEFLAGDSDAARKIREDEAAAAVATERAKRLRQQEVRDLTTAGDIRDRGINAAAQEVATLQRRLIVARDALGDAVTDAELMEDRVRLNAAVLVAERRHKEALDKATTQALLAAGYDRPPPKGPPPRIGAGAGGGPSWFQRTYGRFTGRDPLDVESGKRFLASRAFSTAAYGISGGLLYGGIQAITSTIREAEELEAQLNVLESQYIALDRAGELPAAKEAIFEIARETGVATDQVAKLAVQFTGAFRTPEAAEQANRIATELAVIGDLEPGEIFNDLIAGARAFAAEGSSVEETARNQVAALEQMGDLAIQARNLSGVAPKELLDFLGRVGPSAQAASIGLEELNAIGAAVLQGSGLSGAALGDQFNRILTDFQANAAELYTLVEQTPQLDSLLGDDFDAALYAGDASALFELLRAFEGLSDDQLKRNVISELGSRREGQTLAALFENAATAIEIYDKRSEAAGTRTDEFKRKQETLRQQIKEFRVEIEQLGLAIFESGLGDFLTFMVEKLTLLATAVKEMLTLFSEFNDATGGLAIKLAALAGTLKLLGLAGRGMGGLLGLKGGIGGIGARLGQTTQPGGFFSPYVVGGAAGFYGPAGGITPRLSTNLFRRTPNTGFLARSAGAGGFRGGLAGGLASIAPFAATAGILELASTLSEERSQGDDNEKAMEQIIQDRVARGESFKSIRDDINALDKNYSVAETLGFATGGTKRPHEEMLDALEKLESEAFLDDQVKEVLKLKDEELRQLIGTAHVKGGQTDKIDTSKYSQEYIDQMRVTLQDYLEKPEDSGLREQVDFLLSGAEGVTGLEYQLNQYVLNHDKKVALLEQGTQAAEALINPERVAKLQTLLSQHDAGLISSTKVEAGLREEIALLEKAIVSFQAAGNTDAALELAKQKLADEERLRALLLDPIAERANVRNFINQLTGQGPEATVDVALQQYRDIAKSDVANPQDKLAALQELVDAQRAAFMEYVDAAPTAAEALRRMKQGFEITPEIQKALIEVQLATGTNADAVKKMAEALGQNVDVTSRNLVKLIVEYGEGALEIQRKILLARRRELEQAIAVFGIGEGGFLGGGDELAAAMAQVDAALAALEGIELEVPERGSASPTELAGATEAAAAEEEAKANKARQEAIARQNALFDIEAAKAGDDAVALAKIAQRRAAFAQSIATTESERLQAVAQYIEATNQLNEALLEQYSAQRDLKVAKSFDDPVKAARAAVQDAKEALYAARGIANRARAQAELIRAERALNDAIQEAFAARVGILIASAEATGDSVEVARQQLRIINNELKRTDLNQTERDNLKAEQIAAQAGVRDAILSEERATIEYQLAIGQITKQQALGALQQLLTIPKLTEEQIREINLAIKNLKDQLGQDFQFNLPTQLGLPTVYEVRRLGDSGGTGQSYQDNRQITVNVYAETDADPDQIATQVASVVGDPSRTGTVAKRF